MTKIKYVLILFLCVSFFQNGYTQSTSKIDSYLRAYDTASLTHKISLFHYFFNQFDNENEDTVIYYVNDLRKLGLLHERKDAIAMANFGMVPYLQENALYKQANHRLKEALKYYLKVQNDTMLSAVYNALGNTAYLSGNSTDAEIYYKQASDIAKGPLSEKYFFQAQYNLSILYIQQSKNEEAKQILDQYIQFLNKEKLNKKLASAYGMLGQLYMNQKKSNDAIDCFNKSINYGLSSGILSAVANSYTNMGIAEYLTGNYERSNQYFHLALDYRLKDNVINKIAEGYYNLGDFFYGIGQLDSALFNYKKSVEIAVKAKNPQAQKDAMEQISSIYSDKKDKDAQIATLEKIIGLQNAINKKQSENKIAALKSDLAQSNQELKNRGQLREQKLSSQLSKYKSIFNAWLIVLLVAFVVVATLMLYFKRKTKKDTVLSDENLM